MTIGDTVHDDRNKRGMVSVTTGQEERDGGPGSTRV